MYFDTCPCELKIITIFEVSTLDLIFCVLFSVPLALMLCCLRKQMNVFFLFFWKRKNKFFNQIFWLCDIRVLFHVCINLHNNFSSFEFLAYFKVVIIIYRSIHLHQNVFAVFITSSFHVRGIATAVFCCILDHFCYESLEKNPKKITYASQHGWHQKMVYVFYGFRKSNKKKINSRKKERNNNNKRHGEEEILTP